jgi:hypothetical protein
VSNEVVHSDGVMEITVGPDLSRPCESLVTHGRDKSGPYVGVVNAARTRIIYLYLYEADVRTNSGAAYVKVLLVTLLHLFQLLYGCHCHCYDH